MSFKSREKKRRIRAAQADNRRKHPERWYLTIVSRSCCCNACGGSLRDGAECVYRHEPREILCFSCAQGRKVPYRLSLKWERRNRKRKGAARSTPIRPRF
jgi:hypothetical protein